MASSNLLWFFCLFILSTSASTVRRHVSSPCPHDCHCATNHTTQLQTYHCSSLEFVNKLSSKENAAITSLDISNISLHTLDKRLKKLVNLERLNLANNKLTDLKHFPHMSKLTHLNLRANYIKSFAAKHLPSTLRSLDVSHTYIKELPQDITRLHHLKHIAVYGNSFSCNRESLETRDFLLENEVKLVGQATCEEPEKFKGQSWFYVVDFDEFFKLHDQEGMLGDEPVGSGDGYGSGEGAIDSETKFPEVVEEPIQKQNIKELESAQTSTPEPETTTVDDMFFSSSGDGPIMNGSDKESDPSNNETIPGRVMEVPEEKHANLGTNIFLGIFLLCLVSLLIYAIKKNKERKREARRKKRQENLKQRAAQIEMMPKNLQRKPSDKQNGNSEQVPLMNGQNGNSKPDANELPSDNSQPLLEKEPVNDENNEDYVSPSAPLFPTNSDVKTVKVKASEIPDSVPQTPILVSRSRTSDGNLVVTPKPSQRNS